MATTGPTSGQNTTSSVTSGAARLVRDSANSQFGQQKQRATNLLGDVARAVRNATQQMDQGDAAGIASYANRAADQIDRFSEALRNRELEDLARDVRRFARQQPALFLGTAFGLGLLAARFLKSSGERTEHDDQLAMQEQLSGAWTTGTATGTTRPAIAHDMPPVSGGGTARITDADLDLERP